MEVGCHSDMGADCGRSAPAAHTPDNGQRLCSWSSARCRTPCKARTSPRRLAGEPQTAVFRLSPNTPSKASFPPFMGEKCYLCVRYNVSPMSQVAPVPYFLQLGKSVLHPKLHCGIPADKRTRSATDSIVKTCRIRKI